MIIDFVPNGWKKVKIPEVLFFQEGPGVRNWQFTESGVKLLNVGNINFGKIDLNSTSIHLSNKEANGKYAHFLVDEGDLLIACSGIIVSNFHNKIAFAEKSHLPLCLNTSTMRFKSLNNKIDLNYFKYYLQTVHFTSQLQKLITGSAQLNFGPSHIKKIDVLLPPFATQKRIAQILDDAQALKQKTELLLKEYDALANAIFLDMFGDPVTNPNEWEISDLFSLCNKITDGTHQGPKFIEEGIPFLFVSNIVNNKIEFETKKFISLEEYNSLTKNTPIEKNDILYTSVGSYGNPAIVNTDEKFCFQRHIAHIKPNHSRVNFVFLHHMMMSPIVKRQADRFAIGVAQKTLNLKTIRSFEVFEPPISLQNQFAEKITLIEKQKELARQELKESEDLFNCLLQKAFKGELV
jgi:type I restriction enzyme, S subunit